MKLSDVLISTWLVLMVAAIFLTVLVRNRVGFIIVAIILVVAIIFASKEMDRENSKRRNK